ncbi:hypothetical protein FVR03_12235 [Pontibacter qinzhouensis]|uniref:Uncharacterized protein n=1 Tax=Pontibacter qinzhouensis TaxID=2603253 RepID=A0A5C8K8N2_9BACT|nr:hypothetical protein [Pontibacter qinzhouensis]TXK45710.1 hypothetical protein FVR03_12235 [Pontibacter qinzhouensis]
MKAILFLTSALLIFNVPSFSQDIKMDGFTVKDYASLEPKVNGNNIYRSDINHYRIKIPKSWSINKPNSIGVEFNAVDPLGMATMNVHVTHFDNPPKKDAHDFPVSEALNGFKQIMPITILLESKKTYVNNLKCLHVKVKSNIKSLDDDYYIITRNYVFLRGNRMISLTYQVIEEFDTEYSTIFEDSVLSFVFEDHLYKIK